MKQLTDINGIEWSKDAAANLYTTSLFDIEPSFSITADINFADNFWDFSNFNKLHIGKNYTYKYDFSEVKQPKYRQYLKKMVLRELYVKTNRFPSVSITFSDCKTFVKYLESINKLIPSTIRNTDLKEFVKTKDITEKTKKRLLINLRKLLEEIELDNKDFNINKFKKTLNSIDPNKIKIEIENAKTNNIPRTFLNKIIQVALENIDNQELNITERMFCCMLLILSQTGIRRGEALLLETNKIHETTILNGKKKAYTMEFLTFKTTPQKDGKITETIMTDIALKAYRKLEELGKERREKKGKVLFPNTKGDFTSTSNFTKYNLSFFAKNQHKLGIKALNPSELKLLERHQVKEYEAKGSIFGLKAKDLGATIYYVNPHQFRVAVCNEFKKMGIGLQWIKDHMNHLTEDMTKHHFRNDERDFLLEQALIKRASKDGTGLVTDSSETNHKEIKQELNDNQFIEAYNAINKFLKKKKLNIYRDIDEILKLFKEFPLRENELGFCTKALGKICERQAMLTTLENWYYVRPQVVNLLQFDLTYRRFIDKVKIINHNEKLKKIDERYLLQYDLEKQSLKTYLQNKMLPELELLKTELNNCDEYTFKKKYPNLICFIKKINEIESECEKWKILLS